MNSLESPPENLQIEGEGRVLAEEWRKINILFDYSNFEGEDENFQIYIRDVIGPRMKEYLESFIQVKGPTTISGFTEICDDGFKVPSSYSSPTTADLIVFVKITHEGQDILAWAGPCTF